MTPKPASARRRAVPLLVAACVVLAGCSSTGTPPTAAGSTSSTGSTSSEPDAQALFEQAREKTLAEPTGTVKRKVTLGTEPDRLTVELEVSYDLSAKAWRAVQWYRAPKQTVTGEFIFTPDAAYVTSDEWPQKWHGRWLRFHYGAGQDGEQPAPGVPNLPVDAASAAEPVEIQALRTAKAVGTEEVDGFRFISVEVPVAVALQLASLGAGLRKSKVDPATLHGVVVATLGLDDAGAILDLAIPEGLLGEVEGLPAELAGVAGSASVDVHFDEGFFQEPDAPYGDQLLDPAELNP